MGKIFIKGSLSTRIIAGLLALALFLAGCAVAPGSASATPAPTTTPTPGAEVGGQP